MFKKFDFVAGMLLVFLGTAHMAMTPVLAPQFKLSPADFAAIGLAFLYLGLLNIIRNKSTAAFPGIICMVANLLGIAWICFSALSVKKIEAQGIIPFVALCYLTVQSAIGLKQNQKNRANKI
jgi:hypothetical protein